jgi:DNA polymerase elongation subunit (family B)
VFYCSNEKELPKIVEEFTKVVDHLNKELPKVVGQLGGNSENCFIKIEAKKVYSKIFMAQLKSKKEDRAAKKRYAGRAVWEGGKNIDEFDGMGFEIRRRNASRLSRELQEKVLRTLLGYEPYDNLRKYIQNAKAELKKENPDWELIGVPQGIEALESYVKQIPPHVRGCKYSNEYLGENFKAGDIPKLVYVCQVPAGYPSTDVVCFRNSLPKGFKVDTTKMFEKSVLMKLEHIFTSAGINVEEVVFGTKSLESFW